MKKISCLAALLLTAIATPLHAMTASDASALLADYEGDAIDWPIPNHHYGLSFGDLWTPQNPSTLHTGVDLNSVDDCGREVKAVANGVVRYSSTLHENVWGGIVMLQHRERDVSQPSGYKEVTSQYGHVIPVDSLLDGDYVYRGQTIAYVARGNDAGSCVNFPLATNYTTFDVTWSSHLHFEFRTDTALSASHWPSATSVNNAARTPECDAITYPDLTVYNPKPIYDDITKRVDKYVSTIPDTCRIQAVIQLGYADPLPFFSWKNDEQQTQDITDLVSKGIITGDDSSSDRDNNSVLTKRQVVIVLSRALKYAKTSTLFDGATQNDKDAEAILYAVDNGLIDVNSPDRQDFNEKLRREITYILWARSLSVLRQESFTTWVACSAKTAEDAQATDSFCSAVKYLQDRAMPIGKVVSGGTYVYPRAYTTRRLLALAANNLTGKW